MYFVYVLRCTDDSLYCGVAADWQRRLGEHAAGGSRCAAYTRAHPPRRLAALWECNDKGHALRLEYRFKQLRKEEKQRLLNDDDAFPELLPALEREQYRRVTDAEWKNDRLS